jgi:hypothetical protein
MPLLHAVGCIVLDPLYNDGAADYHQYYFDFMHLTSCSVYNPDQQMHNIYSFVQYSVWWQVQRLFQNGSST